VRHVFCYVRGLGGRGEDGLPPGDEVSNFEVTDYGLGSVLALKLEDLSGQGFELVRGSLRLRIPGIAITQFSASRSRDSVHRDRSEATFLLGSGWVVMVPRVGGGERVSAVASVFNP
jgi:hypothetical protein